MVAHCLSFACAGVRAFVRACMPWKWKWKFERACLLGGSVRRPQFTIIALCLCLVIGSGGAGTTAYCISWLKYLFTVSSCQAPWPSGTPFAEKSVAHMPIVRLAAIVSWQPCRGKVEPSGPRPFLWEPESWSVSAEQSDLLRVCCQLSSYQVFLLLFQLARTITASGL